MNPKKQWLEDYSSSGGQPEGGQGQGQQDKGGGGGGVGAAAASAKETASVNSQQQPQSARPPFARQGSLCSGKCYLPLSVIFSFFVFSKTNLPTRFLSFFD